MPARETEWTAEMVQAIPEDGNRYEVLDGVLVVSPAPSAIHQRAVTHLVILVHEYCRRHGIGEALVSPADIRLSQRRLVQPDVFVVPGEIAGRFRSWSEVTALLLCAEVTSPSTVRVDRGEKRHVFQDEQVPEYWIVDLDARIFERWRPGDTRPEILEQRIVWHPVPTVPALEFDLVEYFRAVLG